MITLPPRLREKDLDHVPLWLLWVVIAVHVVIVCALISAVLTSGQQDPKNEPAELSEARFSFLSSNSSNRPTDSNHSLQYQGIQKKEKTNSRLDKVGRGWTAHPSNRVQPSWTLQPASMLESWTISRVGRLFT